MKNNDFGFDEKDVLELMHDYHSEETRRTRRLLTVVSFAILVIKTFHGDISGIKLPFISTLDIDETIAVSCAVCILIYWAVMMAIHAQKDEEIQKEKQRILSSKLKQMNDRYHVLQNGFKRNLEKKAKKLPNYSWDNNRTIERNKIIRIRKLYRLQVARTKKGRQLSYISWMTEIGVPYILTLSAILCMVSFDTVPPYMVFVYLMIIGMALAVIKAAREENNLKI